MGEACRLIEIWGTPRERGIRYGKGAATEIRVGSSHYVAQMESLGLTSAKLESLVDAYLPIIAEFDGDHIDEMRGIAEGADLPFARIVLMNARTELLKLAKEPVLRAGLQAERGSEGCTTIIVQPERTIDGVLIHGHNWDWKASCADSCVILRVRNDNGPDILTFTEAGGLARFGFNSLGVTVTGNYLECERDYRQLGVPLALIRRKVLQADNPSLAFAAAYATRKSASNNIAISHGPSGVVHDLECAPDETFVVEPRDGLLVHSNHWMSPIALVKLRETGIADSPCSYWRQARAERLLAPYELISLDNVRETLLDALGSPLSICVPPRASSVTGCTATVASFLMRPSLGEMQVAMMPHSGANYVSYSLHGAPVDQPARDTADA